ncbi:hypothetical protein C0V73_22705 [Rhizobium sp. TH135]|uniref:M48 family metalloprotease n=1 Tax=Rhizobium sp. TH135 TaxID=2067451 RepID=UPI000C7CC142|nr:M48 family metalloprotease [Rhizobium sp. TH135]PLK68685.1 hypothetical protein C0V73_22705 [Rhizobium sp. TH135]
MVSFTDFFRPLSLRTAVVRYALICLLRWGLASLIWFPGPLVSYLHPFNNQLQISLYYFLEGLLLPFGTLLSLSLMLAQLVLLWRMVRLIGKDPEEVKTEQRRAGSWLSTPLLLSLIVVLTCCVIGWLIEAGGRPEYFLGYLLNGSSIPVLVGLLLSLLGLLFGGRFVAGAKASMGGLFGINYLPKDHPLSQRVARHAETLGLPEAPAVGVVNVMNAFAMGTPNNSTVVLGQPLMDIITDEELDAVIGHELGHIYHNDMNRMQFAEGFQRMLGNVITATTVILVSALSRNRSDAMLGRAAGVALRQTVFVGSELVVKGISRAREFHADAVGARIASPAAMIGALERLHGLPSQPTKLESQYGYLMFRGSRLGAWFSTHPHVEKRIKALQALKDRPEADTAPEAILHSKVDALAGTAAMKLGSALDTAKTGLASASTSFAFADRSQAAWASASGLMGKLPSPRFNLRAAVLAAVSVGILALVAPAIYDYYNIDERATALKASASATYEAVGTSLAGLPDAAMASLSTYDEQLAEKDREIRNRQTQIDALNGSLERMRSDLQQARLSANDARAELSRVMRENMRLAGGQASSEANSNTIATLKAEISRQENLVISLRRQLSAVAAAPLRPDPSASGSNSTENLLRRRNEELTAQVGQQQAKVTALERDLATYKATVNLLQERAGNGAGRFGAIAASRDGIVFLTERSLASEAEARSAAMVGCLQFSRDKSCEVKRSFSNACIAVARVSPGNRTSSWQFSFGQSGTDAEDNALRDCYNQFNKRCMITVPGVCTNGNP